jgi:transcriptional regulator with XRE-family HTH domain
MDQIKIGALLRDLRKEKSLSQEQLAEQFGVSSRSVSRWENGNTMPDISIIIELADFYDIDIRELLSGERKSNKMDENLKETLVMVADYTEEDKKKILDKVYFCGQGTMICAVLVMLTYFVTAFLEYQPSLLVISLILASGIFAINTIMAGLQLKGRMSKERNKKKIRASVAIWVGITLLILIFMTFILPGILVSVLGMGHPVA